MDYLEMVAAKVKERRDNGDPLSTVGNFEESDFPGVDFKEMCSVLREGGYIRKYIRSFALTKEALEEILS